MAIKPKILSITENQYRNMDRDYAGYCPACGEIEECGCEPDLRQAECPSCGKRTLFGIQECLLMGWIDIIEDTKKGEGE